MIPKEIIRNYIKKQIDSEVLRQIRYMNTNNTLYPTTIGEVLNLNELLRVEQMVVNVYNIRSSEVKVIIWELLGTNTYPTFQDWVRNISRKSEIIKDINQENFNEMKFKMIEVALE